LGGAHQVIVLLQLICKVRKHWWPDHHHGWSDHRHVMMSNGIGNCLFVTQWYDSWINCHLLHTMLLWTNLSSTAALLAIVATMTFHMMTTEYAFTIVI
jgi:hypothetical protein